MRFLEFTDGSLSQQGPFRLALGAPLIIAFMLCIPLWLNPLITLDLSPSGYNKFLEIFKFPIGVLSLSIPLVAIVAHIQRTIQTSSKIETTKKKNISDGFFSHHKFITEALSKLPSTKANAGGEEFEYKINDPYLTYNYLFEKSSYQAGVITEGLTEKTSAIENEITSLSDIIYKFKQESFSTLHEELFSIHKLNNHLNKICHNLSITIPDHSKNRLIMDKSNDGIAMLIMPFCDEDELKKKVHGVLTLCHKSFSLINLDVNANPAIRAYATSKSADSYHLSHLFNSSIKTHKQPSYTNASSNSQELDNQYFQYTANLLF